MSKFALLILLSALSVKGATWFVDGTASGANNGTSWANAWTSPNGMSGLSAGDTVQVSGGVSGSSQTYNLAGSWSIVAGSAGNRITYEIGQDASHNGTAIFNRSSGSTQWLNPVNNVTVTGNAGDGLQHFRVTGYSYAVSASLANVYVGYCNFPSLTGDSNGRMFAFNTGDGIELDTITCTNSGLTSDAFVYIGTTGTSSGFDYNKFHHCLILNPRTSNTGSGADFFQPEGIGISIYSNTCIGYTASYTGSQHQDGVQTLHSLNMKIYANRFTDIGNYPVFGDGYDGGFTNLFVFNNVIEITDAAVQGGAAPRGLLIAPDGIPAVGSMVLTNVVVLNNTVSDFGTHASLQIGQATTASPVVYTNILVENNAILNSAAVLINAAAVAGTTTGWNTNITSGQGSANFVSYSTLTAGNNFHLLTGSVLKDSGASESTYLTTDADGVSRPQGSAWDIGAYEFVPPITNSAGLTISGAMQINGAGGGVVIGTGQ